MYLLARSLVFSTWSLPCSPIHDSCHAFTDSIIFLLSTRCAEILAGSAAHLFRCSPTYSGTPSPRHILTPWPSPEWVELLGGPPCSPTNPGHSSYWWWHPCRENPDPTRQSSKAAGEKAIWLGEGCTLRSVNCPKMIWLVEQKVFLLELILYNFFIFCSSRLASGSRFRKKYICWRFLLHIKITCPTSICRFLILCGVFGGCVGTLAYGFRFRESRHVQGLKWND